METIGLYYRRGKCPVCGKTAERQAQMTRTEFDLWSKGPVVHKRCEGKN